jgi:hypothetical protein
MRSSERNRYQDCMTMSNIGLASILTDPFGKTATDIMKHVLSSEIFDGEKIEKLIHKSAKKKTELILLLFSVPKKLYEKSRKECIIILKAGWQ